MVQMDIDSTDGPVLLAMLRALTPAAIVVECREFLPFPFQYSFLGAPSCSCGHPACR